MPWSADQAQHQAFHQLAFGLGRDPEIGVLPWCPYGQLGDLLWVRETWRAEERPDGLDGVRYRADEAFESIANTREAAERWLEAYRGDERWRPSIHMPRWASRLTLRLTDVRVERLQEITNEGVLAEGLGFVWGYTRAEPPRDGRARFAEFWNELYSDPKRSWQADPWVWVLGFEALHANINAVIAEDHSAE